MQRAAKATPREFRVALREDGLAIEAETGHSLTHWSAIEGIERHADGIRLYLKGLQALWLPERCFTETHTAADCLARIEQHTGLLALARLALPTPEVLAEKRGKQALLDLLANLHAGLRFLLFRASAPGLLRVSVLQIVLLVALGVLLELAFDLLQVGLDGQFYWNALPYQLFAVPCLLLCAWAVSNCAPSPQRIPTAVLAILTPALILRTLYLLLALLPGTSMIYVQIVLAAALPFWAGFAAMVALVRSLDLAAEQRMAAVLGVLFLFAAPSLFELTRARLWLPPYDEENSASMRNWERATKEAVLYAQPALLEESLTAVRKGKPGVPELYLLALGGYGSQDVFMREVESVDKLFGERFDTQNRSVVLINNPATVEERPMATTIALQRTLAEIGRKMNKEEDVLFLFMTSHGAEDHKFSLELWPYKFGELTPQSLRAQLDAAGIQNRVIVVSACYSGGFIEPLSDPHTLVMSASRADRNSHGCSHEADWTFFGKAYFDEALRGTRSFEAAFASASAALATREATEGLTASEPQIAVGNAIRPILQAMERGLPPEAKGN